MIDSHGCLSLDSFVDRDGIRHLGCVLDDNPKEHGHRRTFQRSRVRLAGTVEGPEARQSVSNVQSRPLGIVYHHHLCRPGSSVCLSSLRANPACPEIWNSLAVPEGS